MTARSDHNIKLSKSLSYLLRHGAIREGFQFDSNGYLNITDILQNYRPLSKYTAEDIVKVVEQNDKQRFALRNCPETGQLQIRANQGHSVAVNIDHVLIDNVVDFPVIHGTNLNSWGKIQRMGLSRMKRTHIHFAPGMPGDNSVISGMRSSCVIYIYIDIDKAISDGYKFYKSSNNVILCSGNSDGILPVQYFLKVIQVDRTKPAASAERMKILVDHSQ